MALRAAATHEQICAIIVTYYPSIDLVKRVEAILAQCGGAVVVSNGCDDVIKSELQSLEDRYPERFHFISHTENNLAAAQNVGIEHARQRHYRYVLLLDDDSEPDASMVAHLVHGYNMAPDKASIGMIASHMVEQSSKRIIRYVVPKYWLFFTRKTIQPEEVIDGVQQVIASGSLIPMAVINAVGHMDESYVIDYIDKEFCLRLQAQGYRILVSSQAILRHRIGQSADHDVMGATVTATNHSAFRRYYIARNRVRTMMRYGLRIPSFISYELLSLGYEIFRVVALESQRKRKLVAMSCGIWDALCGVEGVSKHAAYRNNQPSPVKDHG